MHFTVSPQQILDNRAARKAAGMAGCITGRPVPEMDFFGYSDVQTWRPTDPMDPHCFCFDCREAWDPDGTIDVQLILKSHEMALWTYRQVLPPSMIVPNPFIKRDLALPMRSEPRMAVPDDDPVPTSLPPLKERDFASETDEERLKMELAILKGKLHGDLVLIMDKLRAYMLLPEVEKQKALKDLAAEEEMVSGKLAAVELLLK